MTFPFQTAAALLFVAAGTTALWRAWRDGRVAPPWRAWFGSLLVGWGGFNLAEGLIDHQLLGIHHVRSGPDQLAWDVAFLAFGGVLVAAGWIIARGDPGPSEPS